ncbi:AmpG family muropeptide MFS transporter [Pelagibaculum spongiae]|uniref:AmpG family muropeptide MFS transporter n=1 Tax=Pelagibaculum spongiae TaxID=2080658 RepID=A0A2V1H0I2_9GAMM|nr:AmpG family muropeptide MFS transporter [Pelagibaculum spongiae]PVZ69512.1 AmpG family muropeptide MFS transporter [Pelagibaculum spongiae]
MTPSQPLTWRTFANQRMLVCLFTGFASGLPLYILISLAPAWLRDQQVSLKEIGFFTLATFPYTWKFIWAPLMERFQLPFLGRRRGWMLISQIAILIAVATLGRFSPTEQIWTIGYICFVIAFFSASQDIVLDAYRREVLSDAELGLGNSLHINAYRIAGLVPGSLSLILADHMPWQTVFEITALFMLIAIAMTLFIKEPEHPNAPPTSIKKAVVEPFKEFFGRHGVKYALTILAFMFLYKLGDSMATALSTPFYLDLGYSKTEIGIVAKHAGLWPVIFGGIFGGILMIKTGINRALWLFGVVQIVSILGFAYLANAEKSLWILAFVIAFEYLGVGLGTAAFVAFIARTTSRAHTITQFALFTALTAIPRTITSAYAGVLVESVGWSNFFYLCTLLAIPGMFLLLVVAPWNSEMKVDGEMKTSSEVKNLKQNAE